jgi:hypothetical protein
MPGLSGYPPQEEQNLRWGKLCNAPEVGKLPSLLKLQDPGPLLQGQDSCPHVHCGSTMPRDRIVLDVHDVSRAQEQDSALPPPPYTGGPQCT